MKLYSIDFETTMCFEEIEAMYILKSENKPTLKEAETALHTKLYSGCIYVNSIEELKEADIRGKNTVFMDNKII